MQRERSDDAEGTAGARSLCCLSADFHVTQLYIHSIYIYTIIRTLSHIGIYIYIINTKLLYTLFDAICISYHRSVHGILSRWYMSYHMCGIFATDKPQCFHSFIDGIRV